MDAMMPTCGSWDLIEAGLNEAAGYWPLWGKRRRDARRRIASSGSGLLSVAGRVGSGIVRDGFVVMRVGVRFATR